ncbi:MAG: ATP-binding protein [Bacteroidales bacterium]
MRLRFLIFFALLSAGLFAQNRTDNQKSGIYLLISSYNPDTKRMSDFIADFEGNVVRIQEPHVVIIEDLGCKNFGDEAHNWTKEVASIMKKYKNQNLKAIILLGQEAWAAFLQLEKIPEGVPFFAAFASQNGIELPKDTVSTDWMPNSLNMAERATRLGAGGGILTEYNVVKNIELIKSFYPDVSTIVFVSDKTYGGVSLQALVRKEMQKYPELGLILVDGRKFTIEQSEKIIASLPEHSVILLGTWRVNREGIRIVSTSLAKLVAANPKIPVFSLSSTGIGSIAIGGFIPRYGSNAIFIVNQIKNYYKGKTDPVWFVSTEGEYQFDKRKLDELGIREDNLPLNSIIIESEDPRVSQYENYIIIISCISLIIVCLFIYMTIIWSRNKRLRRSLELHEKELIEAKEQAEESDRLKTSFLANMSHEIRTPLNAIVGFSDILSTESLEPEEKNRYNQLVSQNSEILLTLVNDILDISRLETGNIKFSFAEVEVNSLIQQVLSTTYHLRKPAIDYLFSPSKENYTFRTDPKRLIQVLINLITNANKFTEAGSITLDYFVEEERNRILFSVADTGIGVPRNKQKNIFNRFEKLDEYKQGTGLGLAICKQIINRLGGEIWIDSTYTAGAKFYFTHPTNNEHEHH